MNAFNTGIVKVPCATEKIAGKFAQTQCLRHEQQEDNMKVFFKTHCSSFVLDGELA